MKFNKKDIAFKNKKYKKYYQYFIFLTAILCIIILVNIGLIFADDKKITNFDVITKIKYGNDILNLTSPTALAIDTSENIFICDTKFKKVLKINESKEVTLCLDFKNIVDDCYIKDMSISNSGYLYLADAKKNLVYKFNLNDKKLVGKIGESSEIKLIKKIKYILNTKLSELVVIDELAHEVLIFNEDMKLTKTLKIPLKEIPFSYVQCVDSLNNIYISTLINNDFNIMNISNINTPIFTEKCKLDYPDAKISDCKVIGFDEKDNIYVKTYIVDNNGYELAHYLVKFDNLKKTYTKLKIKSMPDNTFVKPFLVIKENNILTYEITSESFNLIKYIF